MIRKETKHDKFVEGTYEYADFLKRHKWNAVLIVVIVAAIFLLFLTWRGRQVAGEAQATISFETAAFSPMPIESRISKLRALARQHQGESVYPLILGELAEACSLAGQHQKAADYWAERLSLCPADSVQRPWITYRLAREYEDLPDLTRARQRYQEVVEGSGDDPIADLARERLANLGQDLRRLEEAPDTEIPDFVLTPVTPTPGPLTGLRGHPDFYKRPATPESTAVPETPAPTGAAATPAATVTVFPADGPTATETPTAEPTPD